MSEGRVPCRRILFVTPPGYGHLFPVVPLAWAFRAAGHDVRIATCGVAINAAARAGLTAVDVAAPGADLAGIQRRHSESFRQPFPPRESDPFGARESVFPEWCDVMADGVVKTAEEFRPDLIVHTPEAMSALIASARLRIPAVFFGLGLAHTPALMLQRGAALEAACERHNVQHIAAPVAWLDLCPPSLRQGHVDGLPMRYIPFNGGQTETCAIQGASTRCVAVTLGTIVPFVFGLRPLQSVIAAAATVDATFVLAYGYTHTRDLGTLPENVRALPWIGLDALLRNCTAAIHHGGFGTTLGCLSLGLPQLILPQGSDQYYNAEALKRWGAALVPEGSQVSRDLICTLITGTTLRQQAARIALEMADMPPPADVIPHLIRLTH